MEIFILVALLALNGAISWWNAYVCGSVWLEAKQIGGFMRVLVWCGAIQSSIGFSMLILCALAGITAMTGYLPPEAIKAMINLWYVAIIVPALGSGIIITVHSWIELYRERSLMNMGFAAWNTLSTAYNVYSATQTLGPAIGQVFGFFGDAFNASDNAYWRAALIVILLVAISLLGGVLITATLIKKYAASRPLPAREAMA